MVYKVDAFLHDVYLIGTPLGCFSVDAFLHWVFVFTSGGTTQYKTLDGILSAIGSVGIKLQIKWALAGTLISTGSLIRWISRSLSGSLIAIGALTKRTYLTLNGIVQWIGSMVVHNTFYHSLSGMISFFGDLFLPSAETKQSVFGELTFSGEILVNGIGEETMRLIDECTGNRIRIYGYNGAIANTVEEVWEPSQVWVPFATAVTLEFASTDNTKDIAAGTGAQKVIIVGLDANYKIQTEELATNGQTAVVSSKQYLRVLGFWVSQVGSDGVNAGIISLADAVVTWTTGTASDLTKLVAQIAVGICRARQAIWTVPIGLTYKMTQLYIGNRAQICDYHLDVRTVTGIWVRQNTWSLAANVYADHWPAYDLVFEEKEDIRIRGIAATTGAIGTVCLGLDRINRQ